MKNYILFFDSSNYRPLGNDGTIITHLKRIDYIKIAALNHITSLSKIKQLTQAFLVINYTQKMCEMNNTDFYNHIVKTARKLI